MNVTAEKSAMRLKGSSTKWEHPFRHKLRMREARKIMAREEKDASKIGRMEGSGWQVIPNNPQYLSEYREILEALKGNTREKPLSVLGMK